jgi:hypothetical protein
VRDDDLSHCSALSAAGSQTGSRLLGSRNLAIFAGAVGYWSFDNALLWSAFNALGESPELVVILLGYLIGQLGALLPLPSRVGGIGGGLVGTLIVYGGPADLTVAAVRVHRAILFWLPLVVGASSFVSGVAASTDPTGRISALCRQRCEGRYVDGRKAHEPARAGRGERRA